MKEHILWNNQRNKTHVVIVKVVIRNRNLKDRRYNGKRQTKYNDFPFGVFKLFLTVPAIYLTTAAARYIETGPNYIQKENHLVGRSKIINVMYKNTEDK